MDIESNNFFKILLACYETDYLSQVQEMTLNCSVGQRVFSTLDFRWFFLYQDKKNKYLSHKTASIRNQSYSASYASDNYIDTQ
ncbi:hypothetical protein [Adhaeribacter pallidiroseus]|uniref:hypothetical protein n=1 Tax=Adhaeribacter pallidiroseus TaxID=2072847 RepID=UPI0011C06384|nr:hypothetical protein [Adhaeribacter pallidiroseus]